MYKNHTKIRIFSYCRKWVAYVNSPIIFCHNDLQGGNILLRNDLGDSGMFSLHWLHFYQDWHSYFYEENNFFHIFLAFSTLLCHLVFNLILILISSLKHRPYVIFVKVPHLIVAQLRNHHLLMTLYKMKGFYNGQY